MSNSCVGNNHGVNTPHQPNQLVHLEAHLEDIKVYYNLGRTPEKVNIKRYTSTHLNAISVYSSTHGRNLKMVVDQDFPPK